jgi:hypothetical protein
METAIFRIASSLGATVITCICLTRWGVTSSSDSGSQNVPLSKVRSLILVHGRWLATRSFISTLLSAGCLGLQAVWVLLCYVWVANAPPEQWLAGLAGLLGIAFVVCPLSAVGACLGYAGRDTGWGWLAFGVNALAFLASAYVLLLFFWPRG